MGLMCCPCISIATILPVYIHVMGPITAIIYRYERKRHYHQVRCVLGDGVMVDVSLKNWRVYPPLVIAYLMTFDLRPPNQRREE